MRKADLNRTELRFLEALSTMPKGRCGYYPEDYARTVTLLANIVQAGLVKERRLGPRPGYQITDAGRMLLAGASADA